MRNEFDDKKQKSTSHLCGSSYFFNDNTKVSVCNFHVAIMTNLSVTAPITLKSNIVVPKIGTRTLCCCLSVFVQLPVCANRSGTCHKKKCIMTHPSTLCVAKCGVCQKRLAVCVGPPIFFMTIENNVYAIMRTRWLRGLRSIRTSQRCRYRYIWRHKCGSSDFFNDDTKVCQIAVTNPNTIRRTMSAGKISKMKLFQNA